MLDFDYSTRLGELIKATPWDIELPHDWKDYFEERGEVPSYAGDDRNNQRLRVRTHGILFFEKSLPFCCRSTDPIGVYTRDFSRNGIGILSSIQLFPEEMVRVILPTFWIQLRVVRVRRVTSACYEIGCTLLHRNDPSNGAFVFEDHLTSCGSHQ